MTTTQAIAHQEQMEALRKDFASAWLSQEIQLRRLRFTPRQLFHAQRCAWLVFMAVWKRLK